LCFAKAYGFRNIQNVLRGIKGKTKKGCPYHFVEIMACPSGCLNGGGQIKGDKSKKPKDIVNEVAEYYNSQQLLNPEQDPKITDLYKLWLNGPFSADTKTQLHTQYHNRQKTAESISLKW
jgi:iron only hydrogenase large subunit-like protein